MVDVEAQYPRRVCELAEVRGDPRHGQQQRCHRSTSRRAQARRHAAGRSDPVQALWSQAHSPVHRHEAPYPALQLQPRLDGQWRPPLHRLRRITRDAIEEALLGVVGPGAIAAATAAAKEAEERQDQVRDALSRDLEAARYAADRAFRQYDAADPANRLVASELEARWNRALAHAAEVEGKIAMHDAATPAAIADPASLGVLASNLKTVWDAPTTDARLKKRIVRTLVHEVVADIDDAASEIVLIVHWVGGAHSELRLPKRRRGQRNSTSADVIQAVRQLVLIAGDDLIAGPLNRNGLKTGNGNRWTRERVTSMRSYYQIPVFKPAEDGIEPWLNLSKAAPILKIAPKTLRLAAEAGEIESIHPLSEGPWIFARAALTTFAAQSITDRARQNPKYPAGSHPNQQNLFSSIT